MIDREIQKLLLQGKLHQASGILLQEYSSCDPQKRVLFDNGIDIIKYWIKNLKKIKEAENPIGLWDRFIDSLYRKNDSPYLPVLEPVTYFVMKEIHNELSRENITPDDKNPFHSKIALARSLMWTNRPEAAFAFLSNLIRNYPQQSEPWALAGKIYYLGKKYRKSALFYRESFFINPSVLNLWDIKSNLIDEIIDYYIRNFREKEELPEPPVLLQWIGICGVIGGFFSSRRKLSPEELENLEKRVTVFENKYRIYGGTDNLLNLIRLYVFKADYFISQNKTEQVSDTLKKLEAYEPVVYKKIKQTRG
jgi:tetratricopeptide (TPR) repeat protein